MRKARPSTLSQLALGGEGDFSDVVRLTGAGLRAAIGADGAGEPLPGSDWKIPAPVAAADAGEPWGSATPIAGSSVAMPSGWSPSRGNTTPGWSIA